MAETILVTLSAAYPASSLTSVAQAPEQARRLSALADRFGLLATGGSDWHGKGKPNELGENTTGIETVDEIISRGAIRVLP